MTRWKLFIEQHSFSALNLFLVKCQKYYITPSHKQKCKSHRFNAGQVTQTLHAEIYIYIYISKVRKKNFIHFDRILRDPHAYNFQWESVYCNGVSKMSKWLSLNNQRNLVILSSCKYIWKRIEHVSVYTWCVWKWEWECA